ncbi:MAG: RrF2 family transcriptional regulator [Candidatus Zhuqueibacterota bacterium]
MMRLSKKVEYGLIALEYMSEKRYGELTTARELADKFNISLELMMKILQSLVRSALIVSVQGVRGGYYLEKSTSDINMSEIIAAIDGPFRLVDCIKSSGPSKCGRDKYCHIRKPLENIQAKLEDFFNEISLKDFNEKFK